MSCQCFNVDFTFISLHLYMRFFVKVVRLGAANSLHSSGAAQCGKYATLYRTGLKSGGARAEIKFSAAPPI